MPVSESQFGKDGTCYDKFTADIPDEADQEEILTILSEVVSGYDGYKDQVRLLNRHASNALNHTGHGIIKWKDVEYTFTLESGDWNGTVLHEWEGVGDPYEEPVPVRYALQPVGRLISDAIEAGEGPFLVFKWEAVIKNLKLDEVLRKYLYDRHFSPTTKIYDHYRAIFAKHQVEVVEQEEADATRARLMAADQNDNPKNYWPKEYR